MKSCRTQRNKNNKYLAVSTAISPLQINQPISRGKTSHKSSQEVVKKIFPTYSMKCLYNNNTNNKSKIKF